MKLDRSELQEIRSAIYKTILRERNRLEKGHCLGRRLATCETLYAKVTDELEKLDAIDAAA